MDTVSTTGLRDEEPNHGASAPEPYPSNPRHPALKSPHSMGPPSSTMGRTCDIILRNAATPAVDGHPPGSGSAHDRPSAPYASPPELWALFYSPGGP